MRLERPLKTAHLMLSTLDPMALAPEYLDWINDQETTRYLEIRFRSHTAADLAAFVKQMNDSVDNLLLGIFLKDGRRHIGNIKLGPVIEHHARADIGLVIGDRSCWGKGYATEAIVAITAYGLESIGLHRITAGMYAENLGSYKAFLKAGYTEDGRLREYWRADGAWQDEIVLHKLAGKKHG